MAQVTPAGSCGRTWPSAISVRIALCARDDMPDRTELATDGAKLVESQWCPDRLRAGSGSGAGWLRHQPGDPVGAEQDSAGATGAGLPRGGANPAVSAVAPVA